MDLTIFYGTARDIPYEETKGAIVKKSTEEATLTLRYDSRDNANYYGNRMVMIIVHDSRQSYFLHGSEVKSITRQSDGQYVTEIDLDIYRFYKYKSYKRVVTVTANQDASVDFRDARYIFGFNLPEKRLDPDKYHEFNVTMAPLTFTLAEYETNGNRSFLIEQVVDPVNNTPLFKRMFNYPSGRNAMESQNKLGMEIVVGNSTTIELKGMTYFAIY